MRLINLVIFSVTDGGEFVAVEEFIPGCFTKYINNTRLSSISTEYSNNAVNIISLNALFIFPARNQENS